MGAVYARVLGRWVEGGGASGYVSEVLLGNEHLVHLQQGARRACVLGWRCKRVHMLKLGMSTSAA